MRLNVCKDTEALATLQLTTVNLLIVNLCRVTLVVANFL